MQVIYILLTFIAAIITIAIFAIVISHSLSKVISHHIMLLINTFDDYPLFLE